MPVVKSECFLVSEIRMSDETSYCSTKSTSMVDNGSIATTDAQSMESMEHSQERTIAADQTGLLFVSGQSSSRHDNLQNIEVLPCP